MKCIKKIGKFLIGIILFIWTIFPIYWMFSLSIRNKKELVSGASLLPKSFSLENFINIFKSESFKGAAFNSLFITIVSLIICMFIGLTFSYVLSNLRFKFGPRKFMVFWTLLVRILPPITIALPLYIIFNRIGLMSTKMPILLSHVLLNLPFVVWHMTSFFGNVSKSLEESAKIDGASEWQVFRLIILPMMLPGIASASILSFMTSWNEYLFGSIFLISPRDFTIPILLSTMNSEQELTQWANIAAGGIFSILPVIIFVIFAQNYLIKGMTVGSVKE